MRPADRTIGDNYLERWYIVRWRHKLNIYLHKFSGSDDDRALHDHPWWSVSFMLRGHMIEHTQEKSRFVPWLWPVIRRPEHTHRLEILEGPVWTLFITGPKVRSWGFHCPQGWRHWREFTTPDGNGIGRGCE